MKRNEKGFSVLELLLIVVVIGLIAGIGWYVWQSKHKTTPSSGSSSNTTTASASKSTVKAANAPLEITALGVKVNDPEGRGLQVHAEKICAAQCDTEDSFFIRDNNNAYFTRCEYPTGVDKLTAQDVKDNVANPDSYMAKHSKKIGNTYYYITPGSHFQSPCGKLQDGDEAYEDSIRQYVLDNLAQL